jgi:PadR family transcriptional regulator, regulatory protein PadR
MRRKECDTIFSESCSCAGAQLDRLLQPAILSILAREHLNGYKVGKHLEAMAMFQVRKPDVSGMYRTLKELERRKLIACVPTKAGATDAKAYAITRDGIGCLDRWVRTLNDYRRDMDVLLSDCRSALKDIQATHGVRAKRTCRCQSRSKA